MNRFRILALGLALAAMTPSAFAQGSAPSDQAAAAERLRGSVESLEALLKSIQSKERDIAQLQEQLKAGTDEITHADLLEDLQKLKDEEEALRAQFVQFAVAVDTSVFGEEVEGTFDWQEELGGLVRPILAELKNATAESRAIGELRSQIEDLDALHTVAAEGSAHLDTLLLTEPSPELRARLEAERKDWHQRRDDAQNQRTALQLQLENKLAERKSVLDETTGYAQKFFHTRGLNLVYGIGAFCLVFFGLRLVNALLARARRARKTKSFATRLGTLLFHLFGIVGGMLAMLLVFNMVSDWFLLGIVIIFLLGVGWASINTLPQHVETVKLMLNIGAVKEDERIVFDGIPWQVESLGFAARLVNPLLDGGVQNLPVKHLVGMHSRPNGDKEEWFPCRPGDWVELSDGRVGHVAYQTPGSIQVVELGGSQAVYQTSDFLALSPKTLSTGFRVSTVFGIDYKHQATCTTEIPARMKGHLTQGLVEVLDADLVRSVSVEFMEAASSSLNYQVDVDVRGEAAPKYLILQRSISRLLVDACNENGWEIPFTQVTMHQA